MCYVLFHPFCAQDGPYIIYRDHHHTYIVRVDCNFPIGYTYHRDDSLALSWPDHILTWSYHSMLVTNVSTLSCVDNFSDHLHLSLLISHFPLIVPQSLSPLRVLRMIPRLHLFPGPRLLQATSIITVSLLLVTCLGYPTCLLYSSLCFSY